MSPLTVALNKCCISGYNDPKLEKQWVFDASVANGSWANTDSAVRADPMSQAYQLAAVGAEGKHTASTEAAALFAARLFGIPLPSETK